MNTWVRVFTFSILLCLTAATSAAAATYGGDAVGAEVTVSATGTTIRAATGSLSIAGGMADAALSVGDIPGSATGGAVSLAASAMHSAVVGLGGTTRSEASTGGIGLTVSGNQISSDFVMARSSASCGPTVSGNSQLVNLVVNGEPITVTGAANQTVSLPNGTVIINAQVPTVGGTSAQLVVIALRVMTHDTITGQPIADASLAIADARIDCSGGTSATGEFVTGGGQIPGDGGKATFGFVAGSDDGVTFRGHFTLKDHGSGQVVHANVIANFSAVCPATFDASGSQGTVSVTVTDNGEPGVNDQIDVSGAYNTGGLQFLLGGNLKNHGFSCM